MCYNVKKGYILGKDLIVKDNKLIRAKYSLGLHQTRFIAHLASTINKNDTDFFTYTMRLKELLDLLKVERRHWKRLNRTLTDLMTKIIVIEDSDSKISKTTLLGFFSIDKEKEIVEYRFDKSMKPYLLDLNNKFKKGSYTKLSFEKIVGFASQYSARLYEVLEMKAKQSERYKNSSMLEFEYDLKDLKELLLGEYNSKTGDIEIPKSYQVFGNFKKRVLEPAYRELKEKGDYFFEYEPLKVRNKVVSIKFKIFKNGEKIKKDFHEKKKLLLQNSTTKALAQEQIRRIIERKKDTIKDKLKYEQKLFQLYLKGELKFDRDIQGVIDNMGV